MRPPSDDTSAGKTKVPDPAITPAHQDPAPKTENAGLKLLIDLAPLIVFFTAFRFLGLVQATVVLIAATLLSVVAAHFLLGKISPMLIVTAVLVTVFGGLTYFFDDPRFIKMKPTVVNLLFAGGLGWGLATGRTLLKTLLGEALQLTATGWRLLTMRWIGLFIGLAVLNEVVWRSFNTPETEHIWVNFKVFGILPLTIIFMALQVPLLRRHADTPSA